MSRLPRPRTSWIVAAALAASCTAAPAAAFPEVMFTLSDRAPDKVQLRFDAEFGKNRNGNWTRDVLATELNGFSTSAFARGGPVHFTITRPAGQFACEGLAHDGHADGRCKFAADEGFRRTLAARGVGTPSEEESYAMAMSGVRLDVLDTLQRDGWDRPNVGELIALGIFDATSEAIQDLARAGYRGGKIGTLIALRVHRITPEFISSFARVGYRDLSLDMLFAFRIHKVTPEFIQAMAAAGYRDLKPQTLVQLRIFNITPEFARAVSAAGKPAFSADQLVKLKLAGIGTGDFRGAR